jgi:hypothetical protein
MSDMTLDAVLETGAEDLEATFLSGEPSLRSPAGTLLLPDTEILPVGIDEPSAYDRPTKRTNSRRCCD